MRRSQVCLTAIRDRTCALGTPARYPPSLQGATPPSIVHMFDSTRHQERHNVSSTYLDRFDNATNINTKLAAVIDLNSKIGTILIAAASSTDEILRDEMIDSVLLMAEDFATMIEDMPVSDDYAGDPLDPYIEEELA